MEVSFEFMGLGEDEILIEVRSTSDDEPQEFKRRHISDLTQPLTQEMARHFDEGNWFVLHSDLIDTVSSELYVSLLNHLMTANKFLFVLCPVMNFESTLETLIRHCRHYQLQAPAGQMYSNVEIHTI